MYVEEQAVKLHERYFEYLTHICNACFDLAPFHYTLQTWLRRQLGTWREAGGASLKVTDEMLNGITFE